MKTTVLLATTLLLQLPLLVHAEAQAQAQAQTRPQEVWRCGADGRSYSSTPCSGGSIVATEDARPAADVLAAQQQAQRDVLLAEQLRRAAAQQDARRVGNGLGVLSAPRPALLAVKPQAVQTLAKAHRTAYHRPRPAAAGTSPTAAPVSRRTTG